MSTSRIPVAIIAAGAIIAIALWVSVRETSPVANDKQTAYTIPPVSHEDHVLGNPNAPIILIAYSDFDCLHCRNFATILRRVGEEYGIHGEVAIVFRNFALTENSNARRHAEAAECVAKTAGNSAYLAMSDLLYREQPVTPTKHGEFAQKAGADPELVLTCVREAARNGIDARIEREHEDALRSGAARGMPHTIMLVRSAEPVVLPVPGARSYADLRDVIDKALESTR